MKKSDDTLDTLFGGETVNAIVEYLSPFKDKLINGPLYNWNGSFEETIKLRKKVGKKLKDAKKEKFDPFLKVCKKIVEDWGGIRNIAPENFKSDVEKIFNDEELKKIERISSNSKILSFLDPTKYIIYDSRVSYSINWILLNKCNSNFYFRMPSGRNTNLKDDMDKLEKSIRSKHNYENETVRKANEKLLIEENKTYETVNKLVKKVHEKLWGKEKEKYSELYYTEMILFAIADKRVYENIMEWACGKDPSPHLK